MAKIVLGISSSVSIYKSLELLSSLKKEGHDIHCILSINAKKLVSPKLFEAISGNPVLVDIFNSVDVMPHISITKDAELMVIAPASSNIIGKFACGLADCPLSTAFLSINAPTIIFPSMNPKMWDNPFTQRNVNLLRELGILVENPDYGLVACGDIGFGRLQEVSKIKEKIDLLLNSPSKKSSSPKKKVLITTGGSYEYIDPIRVISNLSSGKMGLALALNFLKENYEVIYLHHKLALVPAPHPLLKITHYETTKDLTEKINEIIDSVDVLIMNAAPCDYRPEEPSSHKIKSTRTELQLKLIKNSDILSSLPKKKNQFFVGFAAETENLKKNALTKLEKKKLDMIIANKISLLKNRQDIGIGSDFTDFIILNKKENLYASHGKIRKEEAANKIFYEIQKYL